jgi:hypothetical protein
VPVGRWVEVEWFDSTSIFVKNWYYFQVSKDTILTSGTGTATVTIHFHPAKNDLGKFIFNGGLYDSISCLCNQNYLYSWSSDSNIKVFPGSLLQVRLFDSLKTRPVKFDYFQIASDTTIW